MGSDDHSALNVEEKAPHAPAQLEPHQATLTITGSRSDGPTSDLQVASRERYLLQGVVAEGGQGRVLHAKDLQLGRTVAVKELRKPGGETEARFLREARITARLQHPAIVPIYEAGRWPSGEPFYAMKLVSGRTLSQLIDSLRTHGERLAALPHVLAAAEAVAYAHSQRVIHRDLKPANVLVGEFGETVVVDWGLSKELDRSESASSEPGTEASVPSQSEYTQEGTVMGTPAYLPPEQAAGRPVDERADVYSLGAILYQLLSGQPPYSGSSVQKVLQQVLTREPTPLARLQPQLPEELLAIVSRAMERVPAHRYATARELAEDLKRFLTGQLVGAHHYSLWERLRRIARQYRAALMVATVALVALVMGGVFDYQRIRHERDLAKTKQAAAEKAEAEARQAELLMEKAKSEATQRADSLTVTEARNALAHSPEQALTLLDSLSSSFTRWGQARTLAADAASWGEVKRLKGHADSVYSARFSPDGRSLLTTSRDHTVRLWDVQAGTNRVLATLDSSAWGAAFSPDGKYVASISKYGPMKLWEMKTLTSRDVTGVALPVKYMNFSPDSRSLFLEGADGQLTLWDIASSTGRFVGTHPGGAQQVKILPDGWHAVSIGGRGASGTAMVWNLREGSSQMLNADSQAVTCGGVSSQAGSFAVGTAQGEVFLWKAVGGQRRTLHSDLRDLSYIAFSPDGRLLAVSGVFSKRAEEGVGSPERVVKLWDLERGTYQIIGSATDHPFGIVFSRDGQQLGLWNFEGKAQLFDVATARTRQFPKTSSNTYSMDFSPDREWVALTGEDSIVRLYRIREEGPPHLIVKQSGYKFGMADLHQFDEKTAASMRRQRARVLFEGPPPNVSLRTPFAWTLNGTHILSASEFDNEVRLSNMKGEAIVKERAHPGGMKAAYVLPNGTRLVTAGVDGTVALWNESGRLVQRLSSPVKSLRELALSRNGAWVAGIDASGTAWLWDAVLGTSRALEIQGDKVLALAFSPNGQYLATGSEQGELRLWQLSNGVGRTVHRHQGKVEAVIFSPMGNYLASGGSDGTWVQAVLSDTGRLLDSGSGSHSLFSANEKTLFTAWGIGDIQQWDVESGQLVNSLGRDEHLIQVWDMSLSPEGHRLAAATSGGLILWDLQSGESRVVVGSQHNAYRVAFSPDGRYVVSSGLGMGNVYLWKDDLPLEPEALRAWVHQAVSQ